MEQSILDKALKQARQGNWDSANITLDGFGIEHISLEDYSLKYINLGDTYTTTICCAGGDAFISSWGDWYEDVEKTICKEFGVIRCGYCSTFTPSNKENWCDVVCQSCNNLVAG